MSTTKTTPAPAALDMSRVEIEAASPRFVPPAADVLPDDLHPARDLVVACRARWLEALARKRHADTIANTAEHAHKEELRQAALDGRDSLTVTDQRPTKAAAQKAAADAAKAALQAVEQRWIELVDGITRHREQILTDLRPIAEQALADLADIEERAAAQRASTARLQDQYVWLSSVGRSTTGRASTENGSVFA